MYHDSIEKRMADEMKLRGRSPRTISSYLQQARLFFGHFNDPLTQLDTSHVREYLLYLKDDKELSASSINQARAALKYLFVEVLDKPWNLAKIRCHRRSRALPEILTRSEIADLIRAANPLRDRAFLMVMYSAGLRLDETRHLKPADIDSRHMRIHVRSGKGDKDRYVMLSERLLESLREYWRRERPKSWLFPSKHNLARPVDTRTIQRAVKNAALRAGIQKRVTPHVLRHCFASHLLEAGTNLRYLQELLGHCSLQTTMVYLKVRAEHATAVTSPLDQLGL